jgi:hypothetical protein
MWKLQAQADEILNYGDARKKKRDKENRIENGDELKLKVADRRDDERKEYRTGPGQQGTGSTRVQSSLHLVRHTSEVVSWHAIGWIRVSNGRFGGAVGLKPCGR